MNETNFRSRERSAQLEALGNEQFDVLVLGGGIAGVAAAHELVRRGYRTALVDRHDFASGTSQESSQLIWGGIKYLAQGHVRMVAGLCRDRNALISKYPDRIAPRRFLYPHFAHDEHSPMSVLAGTYLYWLIGRGFDSRPRRYTNREVARLVPGLRIDGIEGALEYSEGQMLQSDARLTLDLLFDAMGAGLMAANYLCMTDARAAKASGRHEIEFEDTARGSKLTIRAKWLVNCTGVWVDEVNVQLGLTTPHRLIFSKGIHLIVPKIETSGRALTCIAADGRIFFVIPWGEVTLVGTTDTSMEGPPRRVRASSEDMEYLIRECEAKFKLTLGEEDILNTKAGLRPLVKPPNLEGQDFLSLARGHKVWSNERARVTALWGGKFTNCFTMAREVASAVGTRPSEGPRMITAAKRALAPLDAMEFEASFTEEALGGACRAEMVVTLEDLVRRRTNIALKVPGKGWGKGDRYAGELMRLAESVALATGSTGEQVLGEYRRVSRANAAED